jgi:hypothetical protein
MPKEIADAFGVPPESLELVDDDEQAHTAGQCASCAEWARKYAELEAELAECRDEAERYRKQLEALLLSVPVSSH